MAHSIWLKKLRQVFVKAHLANLQEHPHLVQGTSHRNFTWSRRRFIKLAALAAGTAVATRGVALGTSTGSNGGPRIAIVGGGIAGLNAAYQLQKAGLRATVYEARNRLGGRIQSVTGAVGAGLVSDLGGHFINTDHTDMISLAREFGIPLFNRVDDAELLPFPEVAYYFDGRPRSEAEVAEELRPIARQILKDAIALDQNFERVAPILDRFSVTQYLDFHQDKISDPFIRVLLENSIRTEYGVEPEDSSALQLIFNLPLVQGDEVEVLGNSDEVFVAEGGSAAITDSLAQALGQQIRTGMKLTGIRQQGQRFRLNFGGEEVVADYVILAIPFTVLRNLDIRVRLPRPLRKFIQEVDLGFNEKLLAGFNNRVWRQDAGFSQEGWSDLSYSVVWDGSQRQTDLNQAELTFYFGGNQVDAVLEGSTRRRGYELLQEFDQVIPGAKLASNNHFLRTAWTSDPLTLGAYTSFRPGQLTEFANFFYIESDDPEERQEVRVGNLLFAGEQVSDAFYGFMNGSAETGRLAAESILREVLGKAEVA